MYVCHLSVFNLFHQEIACYGPPIRQISGGIQKTKDKKTTDKKKIAGYDLFHQEISGYGPPMRQSSDGQLRQKENAGYGPLQSSDQ